VIAAYNPFNMQAVERTSCGQNRLPRPFNQYFNNCSIDFVAVSSFSYFHTTELDYHIKKEEITPKLQE